MALRPSTSDHHRAAPFAPAAAASARPRRGTLRLAAASGPAAAPMRTRPDAAGRRRYARADNPSSRDSRSPVSGV